ncbi:MAG: ATP-binding protein [Chloroflexota bacterium]
MASRYIYDPELCEVEPIHILGHIQPHGALLALDEITFTILYTSDNTEHLLGHAPKSLLRQPVDTVIGEAEGIFLREHATSHAMFTPIERPLTLTVDGETLPLHMYAHHNGQFIIVEFEPGDGSSPDDFLTIQQDNLKALRDSSTVLETCEAAARAIRALTGHERVLAYKFDDIDQHGIVVAEDREEYAESFLGLHYPATDIPTMARELFLLNEVRIIVDAQYTPSPIIATNASLPPLDLSQSLLRGVASGHVRYLGNMGVRGSMSVAIVKNGFLWGLFACHHSDRHFVPRHTRDMCRFLGMVFSAQISALEDRERMIYTQMALGHVNKLIEALRASDDAIAQLQQHLPRLMSMTGAAGVAVIHQGHIQRTDNTPNDLQISELAHWLHTYYQDDAIFYTHALPLMYSPARNFAAVGSGLLAATLSQTHPSYILWFRPEVSRTVTWGRQVEQFEDSPPLTPDDSFRQWQQSVTFTAERWRDSDLAAARELRTQISDLRVHQALMQNERQMRAILNTLPSIVFVYRDNHILFVNDTAPMLTAYSRGELLQGKLWEVIPVQEIVKDGMAVLRNKEIRIVRKDGTTRWIYVNTLPVSFDDQPAMVGTAFDITERREAAQKTLEMEIERQQIRVLAEFIEDASHDLRTPLSVLMTSLYLLKRSAQPEQQEQLELMELQTHKLSRLINDLTTLNRLDTRQTYSFRPIDINRTLLSLKTGMRGRADDKDLSLKFDLDTELPVLRGDPFELERCFSNLLDNALNFTPAGGRVTVRTYAEGAFAVIAVEDTGVGIAPEDQPHIFKRFYRSANPGTNPGSGLGLSIARKIIEAHNGHIEVESARNEGTIVRVWLPT